VLRLKASDGIWRIWPERCAGNPVAGMVIGHDENLWMRDNLVLKSLDGDA
jgi:hypothetical protein